jgi:hypothetical protein
MPDFKALIKVDSSRVIADQIVDAVGDNPEYFKTILDLCFNEGYPIAMRAGRAVALCNEKYPSLIVPYLDQLVKKVAASKIDGVKRGILKTFCESVDLNNFTNLGELVDLCFHWLANPKESIAIRYYSMQILYKTCLIEPELKNELIPILENLTFETSAGIVSQAKKLLKQLKKR